MNGFLNCDMWAKISILRPLAWASFGLMGVAMVPGSALAESSEAYGLVIEVHASHGEGDLAGLTTYRMYLSTPHDNDIISAMYGDDELPLLIGTSTSFHQDPVASEVLGSQMNPAFFAFYPDMAFDSWLTIGLDGPPSENEGEPLTIGNSNNNWETNFEAGGDVVMADAIGGSVFILNAPNITNNISGEDHRILLGQFTTDGELEGQVNVQMFTQGIINPSDRMTIPFSGVGVHPATLLEPCGCMDETACNYNPLADCDDGSCIAVDTELPAWTYFPPDDTIACDEMMPTIEETMPLASDDCAGVEVVWMGDGPFDYPFGCLQSYTCPRVYRATDGAGQTLLDTVIITVLDTVAPQFFFPTEHVLSVNEFDGEAVPAAEAFVLDDCDTGAEYDVTESSTDMGNGQMVIERIYSTWDGCGNTREFHQTITVTQVVPGCTDAAACNYDASADEDDGSCVYAEEGLDCEGNCLVDADGDGNCDPEVVGCTDESACNYVAEATEEDGSCDYCSCAEETASGYGLDLETVVAHPDTGLLAGMTTYRMYVTTPNTNDVISAIYGEEEVPLVISTTTSFFQSEFGSVLGSGINPAFFPFSPPLEFDSWVTIGLDGPAGPEDQAPSTIGETNNSWETNFEAGMDLLIQDSIGGAIFVTNSAGSLNIVSGEDQRILIGQFTTDGSMSGQVNVQMFTEGNVDPGERLSFFFEGPGTFPSAGDNVCGCTDALACNYDASANFDDGSCEFAESPCTACDGTCLQDSDGDGVCDCLEFAGCTDELACNYDPIYTDDAGNCYYAEPFYDCDGICLEDSDGYGICDPLEVPGCTDEGFCNYNPQATDDDGSCGETDQVNDACTGALELACGESLLMNNEECANVDDVPGCATAAPQMSTAGLWFTFEGTGNEVTLTTCLPGTNFDTYLSVYEGTCGDLTCVAGNDDQSETTGFDDICTVAFVASTVTMNTAPETTYWVLVSGVTGESGDFEIGLTCVLPGCTDEAACNYDATANVDDGSCESTSCVGCTDPEASNYDPLATIADDGSCQYCELTLETTLLQGLTCAGDNNAQVALDISNVSELDSLTVYLDDEEVAGTTFDGLAAGTYTVLVTEGSFCSALVTFTVNQGTTLNVVTQTTDLLCFGDASGVIDATVSNGQAAFTFELSGAASDTNASGLFDGLTGGAYVLEVTDSNGCTGIVDLELEEPAALSLEATITDASAPGTGAIDLTIAGGTAPYNVTWTQDGAFVADTEDLDGLDGPSSFEVVVVDGNGCEMEGGPYAVSDASGVYDLESMVFQVMPNPAKDVLQLQWPNSMEQVEIQIFDASGRTMLQRALSMQPSWTMDVSAWAAGTYHVQLSSSSGVGHASLVIQR